MPESAPRNPTEQPIAPALADRWSPRGFDDTAEISVDELTSILEAARWSPSSGNAQDWRWLAGRRGTPVFDGIAAQLMDFNRAWAPRASALVVFIAEAVRDGKPQRYAEYNLGLSAAFATVQAEWLGYRAHQMAGFHADELATDFELPEGFVPVTVMAIGRHDASEAVPESIRERDATERTRRPLADSLLRPVA